MPRYLTRLDTDPPATRDEVLACQREADTLDLAQSYVARELVRLRKKGADERLMADTWTTLQTLTRLSEWAKLKTYEADETRAAKQAEIDALLSADHHH
jgi:hypothetical protein